MKKTPKHILIDRLNSVCNDFMNELAQYPDSLAKREKILDIRNYRNEMLKGIFEAGGE